MSDNNLRLADQVRWPCHAQVSMVYYYFIWLDGVETLWHIGSRAIATPTLR